MGNNPQSVRELYSCKESIEGRLVLTWICPARRFDYLPLRFDPKFLVHRRSMTAI